MHNKKLDCVGNYLIEKHKPLTSFHLFGIDGFKFKKLKFVDVSILDIFLFWLKLGTRLHGTQTWLIRLKPWIVIVLCLKFYIKKHLQ